MFQCVRSPFSGVNGLFRRLRRVAQNVNHATNLRPSKSFRMAGSGEGRTAFADDYVAVG
jgi:hypothetical protein